jgi:hypothetical protein
MNDQLTSNANALRLFFTEDIYLIAEQQPTVSVPVVNEIKTSEIKPVVLPAQINLVEEPVTTYQQQFNFNFLGKNEKGILIIVNDKVNKVSTVPGTELLRKLVKAIALTNSDFALVNYADYEGATFEDLKSFFNCNMLLSFGVNSTQLGLQEQPLNKLTLFNETKLIFAKNLQDLDSDLQSKKLLWTTLQQLN